LNKSQLNASRILRIGLLGPACIGASALPRRPTWIKWEGKESGEGSGKGKGPRGRSDTEEGRRDKGKKERGVPQCMKFVDAHGSLPLLLNYCIGVSRLHITRAYDRRENGRD